MSDLLVKVEGVSKKFCKNLKRSMLYGLQDIAKNMIGVPLKSDNLRSEEFWSVDNVSFEIRRGECLGLIGPNGAGKSTLLKILNGIISPDRGRVEIRGRVGALIEIGAGFHPMLTGRENIYISGSILGFSKREIDKKFDDILEFSELADFIDTPVKYYSSGMYVRLGFAIAAQMEPDVLLIDEVLAVGDLGFRAKCFNSMDRISRNAALVFVSHQMPQVARTCSSIIVIDRGKTIFKGRDVAGGIDYYYSKFRAEEARVSGTGRGKVYQVKLSDGSSNEQENELFVIRYLDHLYLDILFSVDSTVREPTITIVFWDKELRSVAQCHSHQSNFKIPANSNMINVRVRIPKIQLNNGVYSISIVVFDENKEILSRNDFIKNFQVVESYTGWSPFQLKGEWSFIDNAGLISPSDTVCGF